MGDSMQNSGKLFVPGLAAVAPRRSIAWDGHERETYSLAKLILGIAGGAGYNTAGDILTQTADGRSLNDIWNEFAATLQMHNERRQPLVNLLTFPVTTPVEDVPVGAIGRFEEASEFGVPKGLGGGDYHSMGYSFKWYDLAIRYTWKYLADASSQQVESLNNMALEADNAMVFELIMGALFDNRTRSAQINQQAYNVYPFYNADMPVAPPRYKVYTFDTSHNHFLVSGAATIDSGDLNDLESTITHHGYGVGQTATLILLANPAQVDTIRTFRVANGDRYDFIPAAGAPPFLVASQTQGVQGSPPPAQFAGLEVAGRYGKFLVIEEDYIPAGYVAGFATTGEVTPTNPIGIREHATASLRGLRLVKGRDNDYPLVDSYYQRGMGTGVRHRGAGAVMQIKASGTYDVPTVSA